MVENLVAYINRLSESVPLMPLALIGGFAEEVIAPIPSPFIMMTVGSMVHVQGGGLLLLLFASGVAAVGKTFGSWLIYVLSDKAEDVVMMKFGKWLGVSHKDMEAIGKRFDRSWKDDLLLIILRAVPLFPGAPVAVVCGLIKLNQKTFIRSTFIGVFIRSLMFGLVGYVGANHYQNFLGAISALEFVGKIVLLGLMIFGIAGFYYLRGHGGVHSWIEKCFGKN